MNKITCVIMDWAGTAIDYGCFAPLNAFLRIFEEKKIEISYRQAREPMGLLKIDHIKAILNMPEVKQQFQTLYKRDWNEEDVAEALKSGKLSAAAADVLNGEPPRAGHPLIGIPNMYLTPHIAWSTREARQIICTTSAENLKSFLEGGTLNRIV